MIYVLASPALPTIVVPSAPRTASPSTSFSPFFSFSSPPSSAGEEEEEEEKEPGQIGPKTPFKYPKITCSKCPIRSTPSNRTAAKQNGKSSALSVRYTPSAAQPYSRVSFFRRADRPLGSLLLCCCWWPWFGLCALGLLLLVELKRFWY